MTLQPGQVIDGKYRIVRLLGEGGMGAVFEGENTLIHRRVAIKVLHASVAEKEDLVRRFEREAQAAGRIGSEHIVEVLDLGALPGGERYMVMEFLDGEALTDRMRTCGQMLPAQVFPIIAELLDGLGAAHRAGIIHRDLKPDNVFLLKERSGRHDFVKIVDFGVSKFSPLANEEDGMSMTQTGAVMGTPYYMSPEQAKGTKDLDARSDLFSVGVILYEAVTGRVPFDGETFNELMFKIALQDPPPPETIVPGLDPGVCAIIRKALAREAHDRFASAEEFGQALTQWLSTGRGVSAPPPAAVALAAHTGGFPANTQTPQPWSQSQAHMPAKAKSGGAGLAIALGAALVLGGGGVFYAYQGGLIGGQAAPDAATAAPAEEETAEEAAGGAGATEEDAADETDTGDETAEASETGGDGGGSGEEPGDDSGGEGTNEASSGATAGNTPKTKGSSSSGGSSVPSDKPPADSGGGDDDAYSGGRKIRTGL